MTLKLPIYLDHHATTPVDPEVLEQMIPYFTHTYGNASSRNHSFGWEAEAAVEKARKQVAQGIGASPKEILFTSGATESNNLAIRGLTQLHGREKKNHLITSVVEHKAVLDPFRELQREGWEVTWLPVNRFGQVEPETLEKALTDRTLLVSIILAHNEVGSLNPIQTLASLCKKRGVFFHTDAVQAIGKLPVQVEDLQVDLLSLSAHKIYGPKGVGALYVRRKNPRVQLCPLLLGGGHERGLRSGTLNVPGIVGLGAAIERAITLMPTEVPRLQRLRNRLWSGLQQNLDHLFLNGHPTERLPHNLNVSFSFVEGESLMMGMKELAVSSGSACTSASLEPSYVLKKMGVGDELAHTSIRFGLGRTTTEEEIEYALDKVVETVRKLRDISPLYEMVREGIDLKTVAWTGH